MRTVHAPAEEAAKRKKGNKEGKKISKKKVATTSDNDTDADESECLVTQKGM